uniref:Histidine--tRNA ligase, chloroplastic n=1 Tax=Rhodomela confervoides TaxID=35163 RepID=A0A1Z1MA04_RHOCN|nr:Histidine-tRNA ligase [Rhodomela confervoides]ARW62790.1 Histidine-tRNA ligase [Rhodomela confervoides]
MQPLRGTKDILPYEIKIWQQIHEIANNLLNINNYSEIRTPILESTELFQRSIGNFTDIVNKEMYSFNDQGERNITLRPEGTASIARAFISNKLHLKQKINRLWYLGPMFRYERPQKGRQRQFHQLGIECIGSTMPIADVEVIRLATKTLEALKCKKYQLEINSIGNAKEREEYKIALVNYLDKYTNDLDKDSKRRIETNPLRILDSKDLKTQEILIQAPKLKNYLDKISLNHFYEVCNNLEYLNIPYKINENLVRGLDYYNYTAFEIKTQDSHHQNTICGGGRYDQLIKSLGGPSTPAVGWAIGLERLIMITEANLNKKNNQNIIYIATQNNNNYYVVWDIINKLEIYQIRFELDLSNNTLLKQIKRANQVKAKICLILGEDEIYNKYITIKWLATSTQQKIYFSELEKYLKYLKYHMIT